MHEIRIKNFQVFRSVLEQAYHPRMIDLLAWWRRNFRGVAMVVTSMHRPGDPGVHGALPCRAIDLRSRHLPMTTVRQIETAVNAAWEYDPARPLYRVCIFHNVGRGAHFHLQVHRNTRRRPAIETLEA